MAILSKKIDFAVIFSVNKANPNGDPLNGNRPRVDYDGYGEVTDVCIKRKIRDRLQEQGHSIFVQSDEKKTDGMSSLRNRAESDDFGLGKDAFKTEKKNPGKKEETKLKACEKWFDVRAFGQLFAFGKSDDVAGTSIAIRGPVTVQSAFSIEPITIISDQIVKSVDGEDADGKKARMGLKHWITNTIYVTYGSMNPQLAERTVFSDEDANVLKEILPRIFENDASSARPEGSMEVLRVIWWEHNSKSGQYSSARVHKTLRECIEENGSDFDYSNLTVADIKNLNELTPELIPGF
jgi:CRISPR-associated protein Csd2